MTNRQQEIPVWLVQGDRQTEVGTALVAYDPDTGEARVTLTGADRNDGADRPARECFLVIGHLPQEDGAPGQVLAFPLRSYQVAASTSTPARWSRETPPKARRAARSSPAPPAVPQRPPHPAKRLLAPASGLPAPDPPPCHRWT